MPSYQDIETRLRTVEAKIDFVMKTFNVTKRYPSLLQPGQDVVEQKNLLDIYREVQTAGIQLITPAEAEAHQPADPLIEVTDAPDATT